MRISADIATVVCDDEHNLFGNEQDWTSAVRIEPARAGRSHHRRRRRKLSQQLSQDVLAQLGAVPRSRGVELSSTALSICEVVTVMNELLFVAEKYPRRKVHAEPAAHCEQWRSRQVDDHE
jgi:hypothetical protein